MSCKPMIVSLTSGTTVGHFRKQALLLPRPSLRTHRRRPVKVSNSISSPLPAIGVEGQVQKTSFHHGITYTSYEVNTAVLKFNTTGSSVLIDPWFVGDLIFADQLWFYSGKKRSINKTLNINLEALASEVDVLLITQGLDDHCHLPTLRQLPKSIPVVAATEAISKLKSLGFTDVQELDHGQSLLVAGGRLEVTGTPGALVGPPWAKRQLGLLLREQVSSAPGQQMTSVYFESHCDFDAEKLRSLGPVDVVVSCVKSAIMTFGPTGFTYPLVMGSKNLPQLLKILKPKVLVPLLNTEIDHDGFLASALTEDGDYSALQDQLVASGIQTRVEFPAPPGESMAIAL